jgi:hypothetical protein
MRASEHTMGLRDRIMTLGSCFSDVIGIQLDKFKIRTLSNPFGVIFNPLSLHKAIGYAVFRKAPAQGTFVQNQDLHLNYDFHSRFSALEESSLKENVNHAIESSHFFLKECRWLVITWGTAWVYERTDTGEVVANCHKMPAALFKKSLLTQKRILESFEQLYKDLKAFNPAIRIILTVSPVRHIKDTLELNSVSKSVLRLTSHTITQEFGDVEYFPSYEMMMDDLRDYRFYKADMIHPTEQAEEYIWERFVERYMNDATRKFIQEWKTIRTALEHRPFHPASTGHQIFLRQTLHRLQELKDLVNVDEEIKIVDAQIRSI